MNSGRRGYWALMLMEIGIRNLSKIEDAIEFRNVDLNRTFSVPEHVDLTICVEVAEHLEPKAAPQFILSRDSSRDP
jgi:hypothetical protein